MLTGFAPANAVADLTATGSEVFELPDIVDPGEAQANGYVGRVEAEEKDLYTFVFANGDGTNTCIPSFLLTETEQTQCVFTAIRLSTLQKTALSVIFLSISRLKGAADL